ncbi:2-hydroxyacyl-CoA dehydratase, partial [candidate division WOR-3 bacterium]|nr:2-hydroxyacyl-CoA dehydratase [candidate division WOR-3 bacterium]
MFKDLKPDKITLREWSKQFREIDDNTIHKYCYYGNPEWGIYLSPPATFMVYGARELKRLKFDNSLAALRLWGFTFNESERLFRAHQNGKKVIATMGDLGTIPVIVTSFPDCIPFYPECTWWTPFFNESTVLLNKASELGIPEASCFVRATLAAFLKRAYFPKPDLILASTGASCDDYSSIMQQVENLGYEFTWLEIPYRRDYKDYTYNSGSKTGNGKKYDERLEKYLVKEYQKAWDKMVGLTGINDLSVLRKNIKKTNVLRRLVNSIKELCYDADAAPFPALEMMVIEFGNLYAYADFDEWLSILQMVHETIKDRVRRKVGVLSNDALPVAWVTPTADPLLLNIMEDAGCRVVAAEYVINQAMVEIDQDIDPLHALARSFINASLIGSTRARVDRIKAQVEAGRIAGV